MGVCRHGLRQADDLLVDVQEAHDPPGRRPGAAGIPVNGLHGGVHHERAGFQFGAGLFEQVLGGGLRRVGRYNGSPFRSRELRVRVQAKLSVVPVLLAASLLAGCASTKEEDRTATWSPNRIYAKAKEEIASGGYDTVLGERGTAKYFYKTTAPRLFGYGFHFGVDRWDSLPEAVVTVMPNDFKVRVEVRRNGNVVANAPICNAPCRAPAAPVARSERIASTSQSSDWLHAVRS